MTITNLHLYFFNFILMIIFYSTLYINRVLLLYVQDILLSSKLMLFKTEFLNVWKVTHTYNLMHIYCYMLWLCFYNYVNKVWNSFKNKYSHNHNFTISIKGLVRIKKTIRHPLLQQCKQWHIEPCSFSYADAAIESLDISFSTVITM